MLAIGCKLQDKPTLQDPCRFGKGTSHHITLDLYIDLGPGTLGSVYPASPLCGGLGGKTAG